ncbi:MAG: LptF/LptG family permease [Pseudomonadota bacterium]
MSPINRIQRYIFAECFAALALVVGIIVLAIMIVDVVEQMRTIGTRADITLLAAARLSAMKLPMLIEQTLPFAMLVATMIAFSRLSRRAELPVIRASGVSAWRFVSPALLLAVLAGLFATMALNPVGSALKNMFDDESARILATDGRPDAAEAQVWLRDSTDARQIIIRAGSLVPNSTTLENVVMIIQGQGRGQDGMQFERRIDAGRATLAEGYWRLEDYVVNYPGERPRAGDMLSVRTELERETLIERFGSPAAIGFWDLPEFIRQTSEAGFGVTRYQMRWHQLAAAPAMFAAMAMIGALTFLRLARLGGATRLFLIGVGAAMALFFIAQFFASLGAAGALPPLTTAWAPPLFALFTGFTMLAFQEDG